MKELSHPAGRWRTAPSRRLITALAHFFWAPAPIAPWPGWRFGMHGRGARAVARRLLLRQAASSIAPMTLRWLRDLDVVVDVSVDMGRTLYETGAYEPCEMAWVASALGAGMTVFDVGANVGWYTLLAARCVGSSGHVVAFEPSHRERSALRATVNHNRLHWVRVEPVAIVDSPGDVALRLADRTHAGQNTVGAFAYPGVLQERVEEVPATTLDEVVASLGLHPHLVKLDIEGAEASALRGARHLLDEDRPLLLVEVNPGSLVAAGASPEELMETLRDHRYDLFVFDPATGQPVGGQGRELSSNVVAVPAERVAELEARHLLIAGRT